MLNSDSAYNTLKNIMSTKEKTYEELVKNANLIIDIFFLECADKDSLKKEIIDRYSTNIGIKAYAPDILLGSYTNDTSWVVRKKATNMSHEYYSRYVSYLRNKDYPEEVINKMELYTEDILSKCANPGSINSICEKKKGLVIGDVQSGKTANYIALMNMAADYGYQLIVLLAGMTDSLRTQTQTRVDEGFIGANSSTINGNIEYIGVGEGGIKYFGIPMTNREYDFIKFIKETTFTTTGDYNKPIVMVVKKNNSTLKQMKDWVKPDKFGTKVQNILIIDDEADNASVNTKKPGEEPSTINKLIRELYNNFPVATYVGYTATPFANILIDPYDDPDNRDLFPSDFIVQLKEPDNYFGSKKVFMSSKHLRILDEEEENFLPVKHKKDDEIFDELPDSLKEAINDFILTNVLRTLKGKARTHRTMMINISRFNPIQEKLCYKIDNYLNKIKYIIEQTYKQSLSDFVRDPFMKKLYEQYIKDDFYESNRKNYSWDQIQQLLNEEIQKFQIAVFNNNSSKKGRFNYDDFKNEGARLIAIGGFVLSRGLTLEELLISYFSRNSSAYDTMLQMCRWFGYRPGYEELCRIYISQINIDNFGAVIDAVDDLKDQFREMSLRKKKPIDFGLMIKESPDTLDTKLLVTARNKMSTSKEIYRSLNYSGVAVDTSKLFKSPEKNRKNLEVLDKMILNIKKSGKILEEKNKRNMFLDVDKKIVSEFIADLSIPLENKKFDKESLSNYIAESSDFPLWDVVIATGSDSNENNWYYCNKNIKPATRSFEVRSDEDFIRISGGNNRLVDPGIFNSGLTNEEIKSVKEYAKLKHPDKDSIIASDYLSVAGRKPLLVIYPISLIIDNKQSNQELKEDIKKGFEEQCVLLGFALGFPGKDSKVMVKYRANQVKVQQLQMQFEDEDEEEEENEG